MCDLSSLPFGSVVSRLSLGFSLGFSLLILADALQVWQTAAEGTRLVFIETGDGDMDMDDDEI